MKDFSAYPTDAMPLDGIVEDETLGHINAHKQIHALLLALKDVIPSSLADFDDLDLTGLTEGVTLVWDGTKFKATPLDDITGTPGADGAPGLPGLPGLPGEDGVGISSLTAELQGLDTHLIATLTSGARIDVGILPAGPQGVAGVAGAAGPAGVAGVAGAAGAAGPAGAAGAAGPAGTAGRGIATAVVNGAGHLILTYSDASTADLGVVTGMGTAGPAGTAGRGITSAMVNPSGRLILTYTDAATEDVGYVMGGTGPAGTQGIQGIQGLQGTPGAAGPAGRGITSIAISPTNVLSAVYTDSATPVTIGTISAPQQVKGAFAPTTAYNAGDVVSVAGLLYQAKTGFTSAATFNATDWNQLTLPGAKQFKGTWGTATYDNGDIAVYQGNLYQAVTPINVPIASYSNPLTGGLDQLQQSSTSFTPTFNTRGVQIPGGIGNRLAYLDASRNTLTNRVFSITVDRNAGGGTTGDDYIAIGATSTNPGLVVEAFGNLIYVVKNGNIAAQQNAPIFSNTPFNLTISINASNVATVTVTPQGGSTTTITSTLNVADVNVTGGVYYSFFTATSNGYFRDLAITLNPATAFPTASFVPLITFPQQVKGAFAPTTAYNAGDVVSNLGLLYQAKVAFTSAATFSSGDWNQITSALQQIRGVWSPTGTYATGDAVSYLGELWLATAPSTTQATFPTGSFTQITLPQFKGAFVAANAYNSGDIVLSGGQQWQANSAVPANSAGVVAGFTAPLTSDVTAFTNVQSTLSATATGAKFATAPGNARRLVDKTKVYDAEITINWGTGFTYLALGGGSGDFGSSQVNNLSLCGGNGLQLQIFANNSGGATKLTLTSPPSPAAGTTGTVRLTLTVAGLYTVKYTPQGGATQTLLNAFDVSTTGAFTAATRYLSIWQESNTVATYRDYVEYVPGGFPTQLFTAITPGPQVRGPWSPTGTYAVGDVVSLSGQLFLAIVASTNQATFPTGSFTQITAGQIKGAWTSTGAYLTGDIVSYNGNLVQFTANAIGAVTDALTSLTTLNSAFSATGTSNRGATGTTFTNGAVFRAASTPLGIDVSVDMLQTGAIDEQTNIAGFLFGGTSPTPSYTGANRANSAGLFFSTSTLVRFSTYDSAGNGTVAFSATVPAVTTKRRVRITIDTSRLVTVYFDGVSVGTTTLSATVTTGRHAITDIGGGITFSNLQSSLPADVATFPTPVTNLTAPYLQFKGAWANNVAYNAGDVVALNGALYQALSAVASGAYTNPLTASTSDVTVVAGTPTYSAQGTRFAGAPGHAATKDATKTSLAGITYRIRAVTPGSVQGTDYLAFGAPVTTQGAGTAPVSTAGGFLQLYFNNTGAQLYVATANNASNVQIGGTVNYSGTATGFIDFGMAVSATGVLTVTASVDGAAPTTLFTYDTSAMAIGTQGVAFGFGVSVNANPIQVTNLYIEGAKGGSNVFPVASFTQLTTPFPVATSAGQVLASTGTTAGAAAFAPINAAIAGTWTNLTPAANTSLTAASPGQYRIVGDNVELRGAITSSAANGSLLTTLPAGFRPATAEGFQAISSSGKIIAINVGTDGTISGFTNNGTAFANESVTLTPIRFSVTVGATAPAYSSTFLTTQPLPWVQIPHTNSTVFTTNPAQYRLNGDVVQLRGYFQAVSATGGGSVSMGTLPVGFRPPLPTALVAINVSTGAVNQLLVQTDGTLNLYPQATISNSLITVSGLDFSISPANAIAPTGVIGQAPYSERAVFTEVTNGSSSLSFGVAPGTYAVEVLVAASSTNTTAGKTLSLSLVLADAVFAKNMHVQTYTSSSGASSSNAIYSAARAAGSTTSVFSGAFGVVVDISYVVTGEVSVTASGTVTYTLASSAAGLTIHGISSMSLRRMGL